jgi:hypothetical protein
MQKLTMDPLLSKWSGNEVPLKSSQYDVIAFLLQN